MAVTFSNLDSSWFPRISLRSLAKKAKIFAFIAKFRYNLVRERKWCENFAKKYGRFRRFILVIGWLMYLGKSTWTDRNSLYQTFVEVKKDKLLTVAASTIMVFAKILSWYFRIFAKFQIVYVFFCFIHFCEKKCEM